MKKPTLPELLKTTFYIGAIGYGGPAILALMKKTFVQKKEWISEKEFMNALSLAQILPGATGVSLMGYTGFKLRKLWGGILAPLAFILPASIAITVLAWAYFTFGNLSFVKALFAGLGALVVALLVNATLILGKSVFKHLDRKDIKGLIISCATFVGVFFLGINVIWLILIAGFLGFVFFYFTREFEDEKARKGEALLAEPNILKRESLSAKDFTPVILAVLIFIAGLFIPYTRSLITAFLGIGSLAFGGGFTTIPLIQHQVVDAHGWLTVKQFVDGIALGQITPGPVFITATFIGYRVAGILGALFATLAIFAPSLAAMIALADIHGRVQNLKIVKVIVKGFLSGFIGLLIAVTLQFAFKSLISWQAWLIFALSIVWLLILKKESVWAILGTAILSFFIF
ncbi:MAG: chromate efflux transporter [Parcubacteria group bacterium]|jgi:chromate transporter